MIRIEELSFGYNNHIIFDSCSFHADTGHLTVIKGKSGSGKTTLLDILALKHGNVFNAYYNNVPVQEEDYLSQLYYMTQEPIFCDSLTIKEQWDILIKNYGHDSQLNHYISSLGLDDIQNLYPAQLSGGEKLRASFVAIAIIKPQIILMDEPTASLNIEYKIKLLELLQSLKKDCHIIIATHDSYIIDHADVLYTIDNHNLILQDDTEDNNGISQIKNREILFKKNWFGTFMKMKKHHILRKA